MDDVNLHKLLILCCITLWIHGITRSAASQLSKHSFLGVSPQDENFYKGLLSSSAIKCKDGSKKFDKSQFNDDFCDCPDGSDEPGTSACPNGKFYCKNAGHIPIIIFSSRVNDGICDCCDGSDEYEGGTKCQNTCWEAGNAARDKLKKKISTYKEGMAIRKKEIEKAKSAITKDEGDLLKLKDEEKVLKPLVEKLKERKEQIEKAEEEERQRKEKEEKERKEAQEKEGKSENVESVKTDNHDNSGETDHVKKDFEEDHHDSVNEPELVDPSVNQGLPNDKVEEGVNEGSHQNDEHTGEDTIDYAKAGDDAGSQDENAAKDSESLSREELGRLVASRWTGEKAEHPKDVDDTSANKDHQDLDETQSDANEDDDNGYVSEDDEHKYEDDDDSDDRYDHTDDSPQDDQYDVSPSRHIESDDESDPTTDMTVGSSSWLEKIQKTVKNIFQAVNVFQKPVNISDAAHVRKEYDEASSKLSKIQSKISKLTTKLGQDFGPEKEFYSFHGLCFESKQNKYVYKVCPFKQATQEEGYSTTRLGSWDKFEDSYRTMMFLNGDKCWNGPDRSLKVKLRCGLKNELADVDEPSRCEYLALLSTPALCVESKLKELEDKLEALNKQEPKEGHDEL